MVMRFDLMKRRDDLASPCWNYFLHVNCATLTCTRGTYVLRFVLRLILNLVTRLVNDGETLDLLTNKFKSNCIVHMSNPNTSQVSRSYSQKTFECGVQNLLR